MKKITIFTFLIATSLSFSQVISSGEIILEAGRSVQFDVNTTTNIVTMTMKFPENTWLGVGISPDIALGQDMGDQDDDAIIGLATGIEDRNMNAGTGLPPVDTNDWSVTSNTVAAGERTIIGIRARDTGSFEDFVFPNTEVSFPMIYAKGGATFGYHGFGNYGMAMATLATLSTPEFEAISKLSIFPNPSSNVMNITIPTLIDEGLKMEVFDVLGKRIHTQQLTDLSSKVNISEWNSGLYLVRLSSSNQDISLTKRFVKL
ncbi:T9SS type A sorting domain-containing protein [Lacinutrix sp.]|uniref:T9SS type A sorting domain-containing protein n=1 Tax=Lacinutrix sp. TaxID=1937692 RepID=UPI0025BC2F90|nr:T9SS type A sorting domain-containing protein [Lacinutrix sp.]